MNPNRIKAEARKLILEALPKRSFWARPLRTRWGDEVVEQIFAEVDAFANELRDEINNLAPSAAEDRHE